MSLMTPDNARELSVDEFLAERFQTLAVDGETGQLYLQASNLRRALATLHVLAAVVGVFAFVAFLIASIELASSWTGQTTAPNLVADFTDVLLWLATAVLCLRAGDIVRYRRWLTMGRQFDIPTSALFSDVFEPVLDGTFSVAIISDDGTGIAVAPGTKRPIARFLADRAFQDRSLPAFLLRKPRDGSRERLRLFKAASSEITLIGNDRGRLQGNWLNYYLWNLGENELIDLFDAADIYPGDVVRRLRARITVLTIRDLVSERLATGDAYKRKSLLKKRVTDRLKLEAGALLKSATLTPLEARQLEQLNMGESISTKKPEAWVNNLAAGDYPKILEPINAIARQRYGAFPLFKAQK